MALHGAYGHGADILWSWQREARSRCIYLVHGGLDWMFPVKVARVAAETLRDAGADIHYREIEDLSHTYAQEENANILDWSWGHLERTSPRE